MDGDVQVEVEVEVEIEDVCVWAVGMRSRWLEKNDEWLSPSNAPTSVTLLGCCEHLTE